MTPLEDIIDIDGAPAGWRVRSHVTDVLAVARAEKLLPRRGPLALSLSVVDASAMARLNGHYRGKRRPTDVLSFEPDPGAQGAAKLTKGKLRSRAAPQSLGDLVLCAPVVRRQAKEQGHGVRAELLVLLVHGLLHLLGHDHEKGGAPAQRMAALERRLLARLGHGRGLIGRGAPGKTIKQ